MSHKLNRLCTILVLFASFSLTACRSPQLTSAELSVTINADGKVQQFTIPAGTTVSQALQIAGLKLGSLDRADPPPYAVLSEGDTIRLIRVEEIFETEEQIVPFEKQVVRNESLAEGDTRLVQAGVNGRQEITYRRVMEDGNEISK